MRELLYEDYVDALMYTSSTPVTQERALQAWNVAQTLKMRRVLYEMASVGSGTFPGVDREVLNRFKKMQYAAMNEANRDRNPSLELRDKEPNTGQGGTKGGPPQENVATLLGQCSERFPRYVEFIKGEAPDVDQVRLGLNDDEIYASFLVTRTRVHVFYVGKKVFRYATAAEPVETIRKEAASIARDVERPYHLTISPSMNRLWHAFFRTVQSEMDAARVLIVEPDSFLTLFPFEALTPGTFPDSYREQQDAPLLLDKLLVIRSTSAFRFVGRREKATSPHPPSLEVFSQPLLPTDAGAPHSSGHLDRVLTYWRKPIAQFESSILAGGSEQGPEVTRIFGKKGRLLEGEGATCAEFLKRDVATYSMVHLMCPVLLPKVIAGHVQQPLILFSYEKGDPVTALCELSEIMDEYDPARLVTLTWLGWHKGDPFRGMTLLVEALGLMGVRHVILPLWPADRRGETETDQFMISLYRAIKAGDGIQKAFASARKALEPSSSRKNRVNPARMVLY